MTTHHDATQAEASTPEPLCGEPPCDEPEFAARLERLVANFAPRLFALVEEEGDRADGRIRAWGMAFEDHAEVVGVDRAMRGSFSSADSAHRLFSRRGKTRLVWHNPAAATPGDAATPRTA
ncbi:MAG: hypothetical protein ACRDTF_16970 [Pseudonocardiaceae bacterium]